jgi:hypothetical protein
MKFFLALMLTFLTLAVQAETIEFDCVHARTTEEIARLGRSYKKTVLTISDMKPSLSTDEYGISSIDDVTLQGGWLSYLDYKGYFVSTEGEIFVCSRPEFP